LSVKISNFKCPNCGADIGVDFGKDGITNCPNCGSTLFVEKEYDDPSRKEVTVESLYERAWQFLRDGDFGYAKVYFERVLDRDPEHSDSWWALMLVHKNCVDNKDLDSSVIRKKIKSIYGSNDGYKAVIDKEIMRQTVMNFLGDNLKKALKYADTISKNIYDQIINELVDHCVVEYELEYNEHHYRLALDAKSKSDYALAMQELSLIKGYKDSNELYVECFQTNKDTAYSILVSDFKKATSIEELKRLRQEFLIFGNYKQAKKLANKCTRFIKNKRIRSFVENFALVLSIALSIGIIVGIVPILSNEHRFGTFLSQIGIYSTEGFLPVIIMGIAFFLGALLISIPASFAPLMKIPMIIYNAGFTLYMVVSLHETLEDGLILNIIVHIFMFVILEIVFIPFTLLAALIGRLIFRSMHDSIFGK